MSLVHWLVVILVIIVIFGAGRLPSVMGDLAQGIKAFKRGMKDEEISPPKKVDDGTVVENKVKDTTEV
ncbi:MAG: twin-arginine translocase TatA/TatE family subunit [Micavibrio aeruginosavorus]|uniref:Sec-independent protein translocase protein TatA n=1 Tax=Micavibrio aeruginosavorus TaxID=349221 RepID=A0A2W5FJS8_9BACT|nr:MAG: twin-arginine translocase TatA/TatE family subunit [Micavibrio aeruginosavorus]